MLYQDLVTCKFLFSKISLNFLCFKLTSKSYYFKPKEILMNKLIEINDKSEPQAVTLAVKLINDGCVIALPTDTVYGLASDVQNSLAIKKLYNIKGRNPTKPISICTHNVNDIGKWGKINHLPYGLLDALLPGPVTVVLERTSVLNIALNPGESKVAIRVPDSGFICSIVSCLKNPIALTSANKSNTSSTLKPEEFSTLWPKLDAIFDGGLIGNSISLRQGSTIVDLSKSNYYSILRTGSALLPTIHILRQFGLIEL
ncbi:threonylcarbamoyl-AMP synthase [Daktulosphaira vitifoliae]|uniref:threonylcarbamoyl-AMP synthase n=1 Tax=Daktulosphaira vitifoliae TaxID=58002 RepID=UPI0021A9F281|nr:threonylcarbamoyl-AMP synthase [Daktulosphaira vitifoliae]